MGKKKRQTTRASISAPWGQRQQASGRPKTVRSFIERRSRLHGDHIRIQEEQKTKRISLILGVFARTLKFDLEDKSQWPHQQAWLHQTLETFHQTFHQRVKALDAANYDPEPEGAEPASVPDNVDIEETR